jgi:hypothetical protein
VIKVKRAPGAAWPAVNKTGGEWLGIPIALLHQAHFRAIRRNSTTNHARSVEVSEKKANADNQTDYQDPDDYSRPNSHGLPIRPDMSFNRISLPPQASSVESA